MTYPLEARHILGCLQVGLRVALTYEHGETVGEYHFVKEPLDGTGNYNVSCVYYRSQTVDPLKTCGTKLPLFTFDSILVQRDYYYVGSKKFMRTSIHALPYDWYLCFETDPQIRMNSIAADVEKGKKLGEELHAERQKQLQPMFD